MPIDVYDEMISVLKSAVSRARLGQDDQLHALRRLDAESRRLEELNSAISFEKVMAEERAQCGRYGGRSVFGWEAGAKRIA